MAVPRLSSVRGDLRAGLPLNLATCETWLLHLPSEKRAPAMPAVERPLVSARARSCPRGTGVPQGIRVRKDAGSREPSAPQSAPSPLSGKVSLADDEAMATSDSPPLLPPLVSFPPDLLASALWLSIDSLPYGSLTDFALHPPPTPTARCQEEPYRVDQAAGLVQTTRWASPLGPLALQGNRPM